MNPLEELRKVENFLGLPQFFSPQQFVVPDTGPRLPCFLLADTEKESVTNIAIAQNVFA